MTNYRDDTNETAVVSDFTWVVITGIGESTARASDELIFTLMVQHEEQATITDEAIDRQGVVVNESAAISIEIVDSLLALDVIEEHAAASGSYWDSLAVVTSEAATISDEVIDSTLVVTIESAQAEDEVIGARTSQSTVYEFAQVAGESFMYALDIIEESVGTTSTAIGVMQTSVLINESALIQVEVIDGRAGGAGAITEIAIASANTTDHLHAVQLVIDSAEIMDEVVQRGVEGQAWTANVRNWATSRYHPFTFTSIVVVDGTAYASGPDGVYELGGGAESMVASVDTGKLDLGRGSLTHPIASYLEYELDGTAEMEVSQTQKGVTETYTYELPEEDAVEMTNGRFVFGRGLRGRHFSLGLRLTGKRGYINDLSVETAQTKRRV